MRTLLRFVVLVALFFWQGGFTFYAGVVVPVGTKVLESGFQQGFITRQVTAYMNLIAIFALLPLLLDVFLERDPAGWRRGARLGLWLLMAAAQGVLFWLHVKLVSLIHLEDMVVMAGFRPLHRLYLWTHTVQWLCALAYMVLMLQAWSAADRAAVEKV